LEIGQAVAVTYVPINRHQLDARVIDLDEAEALVRAFLAKRPNLKVDPAGHAESSTSEMEAVRLDVLAALSDLDWIDGYRHGIEDARRASIGEELRGPGATPDPKDGWSPSVQRTDAYNAGLRRGR
jgi:hypothetical protein